MAQFKGVRLALCPTGSLGGKEDHLESRICAGPNGKRYNEVYIPPHFQGGIDVLLEFPAEPGISAREFFGVPIEEPFEELTIVQQHSSSPVGSLGKESTIKLPVKPFQPVYRFLCLQDVKTRANFFNFRVFARDMDKAYVTLKFKWAGAGGELAAPDHGSGYVRRGGYQGNNFRPDYHANHHAAAPVYAREPHFEPGYSRGGFRGGFRGGRGGFRGGYGHEGYEGGYGGGRGGYSGGYGGYNGGYEEREYPSARSDHGAYGGHRGSYRGRGSYGGGSYPGSVHHAPPPPRGRGDSPQRGDRGASPDTAAIIKKIARENDELKARLERVEANARSGSYPSERLDRDRSPMRRYSPSMEDRRRASPSNA